MKKQITKLLASVTLALLFCACEKPSSNEMENVKSSDDISAKSVNYSLANWMGAIDGSKKLSELSIPGTHDSGARYESFPATAKCQNLTIDQQLNAGVRYLDIRCRHFNNVFEIHHGAVFQNINFTNVLNSCNTFLANNPSETIIMAVKEEHTSVGNNRSYEATFNSYMEQNPNLWYLKENIPTLDQARGKIVLLRRFAASNLPKGIDVNIWDATSNTSNAVFEINNQAQLKIQDYYKVQNNDDKWNTFKSFTNETKAGNASRLYINYASGYKSGVFGIPNITTVSNNINPRVSSFFNANTKGRFGIIVMDFTLL
jgi:1-phosphatidylinositol phosphodiesterase